MKKLHDFVDKWLSEEEVIKLITDFRPGKERYDLSLFDDLLFDPLGYEGIEEYEGYYYGTMIERSELKLERQGNKIVPGDIDIVFIPYNQNQVFFNRTAVWEVKIARPHSEKINKSSKSLGTDQIRGLMEDGFPLIGLMHVCMSYPLKESSLVDIRFHKDPGPYPGKSFEEYPHEIVKMDWLPGLSIKNQMNRMITSGLPKYIGMTAFALNFDSSNRKLITLSEEYRGYSSGYFNPQKSENTINAIKEHFELFGDKRYTKLKVWDLNEN
ncbi:hypothetical protein [Pedobacter nutrimenti]|uniref:hypothetical protein n=1 Tax=Pedobacter nutrimenti TaxID=1241337 RepID=UPI00292ED20C|nr:hypothetical protein [Pedobacter nutrimenti]